MRKAPRSPALNCDGNLYFHLGVKVGGAWNRFIPDTNLGSMIRLGPFFASNEIQIEFIKG